MRPLLPCLLVLLLLAGCRSTYDDRFRYRPHPAETTLTGEGGDVRMLASVVGVRNEDRSADLPRSIEVTLRIENRGGQPATFLPQSMELLSGNLRPFEPPRVDPQSAVELAPDQTLAVRALFPFPDGSGPEAMDLSGLNLQWTMRNAAGDRTSHSLTFTRREGDWVYDRRPYAPGPRIGVGVGIGTRF